MIAHYHDKRDRKGRFAKVETIDWSKEQHAMTIENETGNIVQVTEEMSNAVAIPGDSNVIREGMQKVTDWMVGYSSFAQKQKEIEGEMLKLTTALDNAEQRVREAKEAQEKAESAARMSDADARMAREAYGVVAKERDDLGTQVVEIECKNIDLRANVDRLRDEVTFVKDNLATAERLLEVAREERDRFREDLGTAEAKIDLERDDHDRRVAEMDASIFSLRREVDGLHHKCNGLEDLNKGLSDSLAKATSKIETLRGLLD